MNPNRPIYQFILPQFFHPNHVGITTYIRVPGHIVVKIISRSSSSQATHTEETLASNTWCLMLKEVLGALLKAPEGLFSGLTLLSELLPLPLPMHSTQVA